MPSRARHPAVRIARDLSEALGELRFKPPVAHVYDPSDYAREPLEAYLKRFANPGAEALLLGMNPGPWGMVQTGVPFGEVAMVRDFLGIGGRVGRPAGEHPKRPVLGFDCTRSEVSGRRVWGWAQERFGTPEAFFARFFVCNYCPLAFLEEGGKNRTPDKLPREERLAIEERCDEALRRMVEYLDPARLIGIGRFATDRLKAALGDADGRPIGTVLHPSPASPLANKGWAERAEADFARQGIELP
ncbi:uracil-DNA glycosylase family protein [Engelhardtia mirabilis]|uniref:Uracil DNA glycosylase superfamily protein n=1 Tax=Engelhardtia mirabilis TaxID=2528011 RepID=A0A518BR88_9BACT|nr:Uracil DNA glycosylase superfamily protein [Planctomycetes bacterium Pla133]QDV03823.1 Uracil DNA glycosylase superfamily protein [Planctomycetes bacterium Pla86]